MEGTAGSKLDMPTFSTWDVIKLFAQVGTAIWFAATLKSDVNNLADQAVKSSIIINRSADAVIDISARMGVLEYRVNVLERVK